jgi:hypothetical protein
MSTRRRGAPRVWRRLPWGLPAAADTAPPQSPPRRPLRLLHGKRVEVTAAEGRTSPARCVRLAIRTNLCPDCGGIWAQRALSIRTRQAGCAGGHLEGLKDWIAPCSTSAGPVKLETEIAYMRGNAATSVPGAIMLGVAKPQAAPVERMC